MDECLTEYFQRVTYINSAKRTTVDGGEMVFSSQITRVFLDGRQLVIPDGSDDVAFKVNDDQTF